MEDVWYDRIAPGFYGISIVLTEFKFWWKNGLPHIIYCRFGSML